MKSKEKLGKICLDIYRQMYKEAEPSADLDKLMKSGVTKKSGWFMKYYLSEERQEEIIEEHVKKNNCSKYEARRIRNEVYLGASPTAVKKDE